jgi:D-3-phosphoglycerate dehydrogenase / 2-oxoglutarate reductase
MRVVLMSSIDPRAVSALQVDHEVVDAIGAGPEALTVALADAHVAILRSGTALTADLIASAPELALVVRAGSGLDNIDQAALAERGIRLERVADPGAAAVAEMALALMLALLRNVVAADRDLRAGRWRKTAHLGRRLAGRTLGVVGAGNIGTRVGSLGRLLGMDVLGCVEHPDTHARRRLARAGIGLATLDDVLGRSDVVSLHVPLTDATRGLIDIDALARMPRGSCLVNLARGGVVDERALHDALTSGHLGGAALDVHEREGDPFASDLAALPNVVLTPHIGASTAEAQREIGEQVVQVVREWASHGVRSRPVIPV